MTISTLDSVLLTILPLAIGTTLGWILSQVNLIKPKFEIEFVTGKPCLMANYFRLKVKNVGSKQAKNCVVKMKIYDKHCNLKFDYGILHWSRNMPILTDPKIYLRDQYSSIDISSKDSELIDCFILEKGSWSIYSFPYTEITTSYNPTPVPSEPNEEPYKVVVKINGDDASPKEFSFYLRSSGVTLFVGTQEAMPLEEVKPCILTKGEP